MSVDFPLRSTVTWYVVTILDSNDHIGFSWIFYWFVNFLYSSDWSCIIEQWCYNALCFQLFSITLQNTHCEKKKLVISHFASALSCKRVKSASTNWHKGILHISLWQLGCSDEGIQYIIVWNLSGGSPCVRINVIWLLTRFQQVIQEIGDSSKLRSFLLILHPALHHRLITTEGNNLMTSYMRGEKQLVWC